MSEIDPIPAPPSRAFTDPVAWSAAMHAFLSLLGPMVDQINASTAEQNERVQQAFTGTCEDSITIGTGLKVLAASENMALVPGHQVVISAVLDPDATMVGAVQAYDPETGSLTVEVSETTGSGTFDSWAIGIAITADLSAYLPLAGGTMTGAITLPAHGLILGQGSPSSPVAGHIYRGGGGGASLYFRDDGNNQRILVTENGSQTLVNKTLASGSTVISPAMQGTPTTDIFAISDGSSVTIDPSAGEVQTWTLGANRTPTLSSITAGKAVVLMVNDGSGYTLTLTGVTWLTDDGDPPVLKTTGYTAILLFNVGGTLYGWRCGDGG